MGCREVDKGQVSDDVTLIQWEWREEDEFERSIGSRIDPW